MYETVDGLFTGICDAIREKEKTTALISHQDIPARISAISGGGSGECVVPPFYTSNNGGMKVDNGVVSNFGAKSCVYLGKTFRPLDRIWEIRVKFKTPVSWVHNIPTLFASERYRGCVQCDFEVKNGIRKMWTGLSADNGYSWTYSAWSDYEFELDKWYWMRYIFDGERYSVYISINGITFEEIASINYSGQFYQPDGYSFMFGGGETEEKKIFDGSIDLKETYIKIGDEIWWGRGDQYEKI